MLAPAGLALWTALAPLQLAGSGVQRPALPPGEVLVDEVLAAVELEGDPVPVFATRSELELLVRTELYSRVSADLTPAQALAVAVDPSQTASLLEQLVGELVVDRAAERAGEAEGGAALEEERRAVQGAMPVGGLGPLLRASGATAEEFDALVRRRLRVRRYLLAHNASLLEPDEVALRAAYEALPAGEGREPYARARRALRERLLRRQLPSAVRAYVRALGSRARVALFLPAPRP
ncbi:MAG: hypothetical protein HY909_20105 [Deltaproteobacteria bacterium]|nr:hypothetical protein [Deltaproteobacteria bacterium]